MRRECIGFDSWTRTRTRTRPSSMTSDALGGPTSMSTEGGSMSKLKLNITMSIDGFVAGPDQSPEHPLGVGGEELHEWLVPLRAFRESHGEEGGDVNASTPFAE